MKKLLLTLCLLPACVQAQANNYEQQKDQLCQAAGFAYGHPRYAECMAKAQIVLNGELQRRQDAANAQNYYNDEMLRQQTFQNQYNMIDSVRMPRSYGR